MQLFANLESPFPELTTFLCRFDELSEDLRRHEVIETAGDLLLRIIQLINWGRQDKPLITGTVLDRTLALTAHFIAAKPKKF